MTAQLVVTTASPPESKCLPAPITHLHAHLGAANELFAAYDLTPVSIVPSWSPRVYTLEVLLPNAPTRDQEAVIKTAMLSWCTLEFGEYIGDENSPLAVTTTVSAPPPPNTGTVHG